MADIKYGLSETGFRRKRLPDIRTALLNRLSDAVGLKVSGASNTLLGQLVGVFSYEIADLWEQVENVYNAMYPSTAVGDSLSNAAGLAGILTQAAQKSTLVITCYGSDGAAVPYGAQIASTLDASMTFSCMDGDAGISARRACAAEVKVSSVIPNAAYGLTLDGKHHTYMAKADDQENDILEELSRLFSYTDRTISVNDEAKTLFIAMKNQANTFSIAVDGSLVLDRIGSPIHFAADTAGPLNPGIGEVTQMISTYTGWTAVSNNLPAAVGRNAETDISLRQRWDRSVYGRSMTMADSILEALYRTEGVTVAKVYQNDSDQIDSSGRPPHSIEAIVVGGEEADIALTIWNTKALGIDTFGDTHETIIDSQTITHDVYFNRPRPVKVWLKVLIHHNPDEVFAPSGVTDIVNALLAKGQTAGIGQDVILQRFYSTIYAATNGVGQVELTATTGDTAGTYTTANIAIDDRSVAEFDIARIEVTDADT